MRRRVIIMLCIAAIALPASTAEWIMIFDGKDTGKLRGYKSKTTDLPKGWKVEEGILKAEKGGNDDIITTEKFKDFELEFDWRVTPGANSGVMYRVAETAGPAYATGPEYQVLDDAKHADGKNPKTTAGALYALLAPNQQKKLKPVGEWNQARIVCRNNNVEHWLNAAKVVEYKWGSPELKNLISKSKFKGMPRFMAEESGHIAFQNHGDDVWFRNIRVRPLD